MPIAIRAGLALVTLVWIATPIEAQPVGDTAGPVRPAPVVEISGGWAGFVDESIIDHAVGGVSTRLYVSRRISLGPELQYFVGPGQDRDVMATGNLTIDVLAPLPGRRPRTTPYVVVGGGVFRRITGFSGAPYSSMSAAVVLGIGIRAWVHERVFVAADARLLRVAATVGVALR